MEGSECSDFQQKVMHAIDLLQLASKKCFCTNYTDILIYLKHVSHFMCRRACVLLGLVLGSTYVSVNIKQATMSHAEVRVTQACMLPTDFRTTKHWMPYLGQ